MVRIVTILLSVICTAETVFSQVVVTCLKEGPEQSCQDLYGPRANNQDGCPFTGSCVPSMSGGLGFGCSSIVVAKTPDADATDWIAKKPTYVTPVAPDMGKTATELYEWTCYKARPCSKCEYIEDLDKNVCRVDLSSTPLAYGWTIYYLDESKPCGGIAGGGSGGGGTGPGGPMP